ncbi:unnamed protein product [Aspergillus oryzae]|nr:unnamed protein product [Aspergillus oryzae]
MNDENSRALLEEFLAIVRTSNREPASLKQHALCSFLEQWILPAFANGDQDSRLKRKASYEECAQRPLKLAKRVLENTGDSNCDPENTGDSKCLKRKASYGELDGESYGGKHTPKKGKGFIQLLTLRQRFTTQHKSTVST